VGPEGARVPSESSLPVTPRRRPGVQSVEVGASLLRALADADGPRSLSALARAAGMSSAKAHRYLVSYVQAGIVVQSERNGAYDLGPLAVRLGLAALERFDVVRVAGERLGELRDAVDATTSLSMWTDAGPTVARIELSRHPVTLAVRIGTAYPLLTTATGHIYLAFGERAVIRDRIAHELVAARSAAVPGVPEDETGVERLREEVRERRLARVEQTFLVGVSAMAGPLFHQDGRLAAAVTIVGRPGVLDLGWDGRTARAIEAFTAACSATTAPR
jgi:DNA-binding IclR family transcriptional regulator